jgi:hypothetical protein
MSNLRHHADLVADEMFERISVCSVPFLLQRSLQSFRSVMSISMSKYKVFIKCIYMSQLIIGMWSHGMVILKRSYIPRCSLNDACVFTPIPPYQNNVDNSSSLSRQQSRAVNLLVSCVDSPAEMVSGTTRATQIWQFRDQQLKDSSYV